MSFSIPNQALRGRNPNCGICGHRKTPYNYTLTRTNLAINVSSSASATAHFCNRCDFNLPYDEEQDGQRDTDS